jgi:hypothetical protein
MLPGKVRAKTKGRKRFNYSNIDANFAILGAMTSNIMKRMIAGTVVEPILLGRRK